MSCCCYNTMSPVLARLFYIRSTLCLIHTWILMLKLGNLFVIFFLVSISLYSIHYIMNGRFLRTTHVRFLLFLKKKKKVRC